MDNNSNIKQPKLIRQQGVYSIALGVISILLPWIVLWNELNFISRSMFLLVFSVSTICALLGLFLGIRGLHSFRKKLAIVGTVVCAIGLISCIFISQVWLMIGGLTDL